MPDTLLNFQLAADAKKTLHVARQIAKENVHPSFGAVHILKALMNRDSSVINLLKNLNKDVYYIEEWAEVRLESFEKKPGTGEPAGDDTVTTLLNEADEIRFKLQKEQLDAYCIFTALVTPGVAFSFDQLKTFPVKRDELVSAAMDDITIDEMLGAAGIANSKEEKHTAALLKYCIDKTEKARMGKLDTVTGRDAELRMITEILCRRSKPNVMLAGEPGVGKSALADGLAMAIVQNSVPSVLCNARLFELDNGALVAGASYKGEVEDRLKNILTEIKKHNNAILFIDEIHTLTDKHGTAAGAAGILKQELARGEIILIAATTTEEYKKHIEKDEALSRRFELLLVDEPDEHTAFQMIKGVIQPYEQHHSVHTDGDVIKESIRLAKRYIKDRKLPDAAIDLLDRTMAALRSANDTGIKETEKFTETIQSWKQKEAGGIEIKETEDWKWLGETFLKKISPVLTGLLTTDANDETLTDKKDVISSLEKTADELSKLSSEPRNTLSKTDVACMVSAKTGIPLGKLQLQEQARLLNMENILKQRVVGQDHAVKSIADAILESRSGIGKPGQPIGSFFFLGPTGTGKTELAKALAEFLFQDENTMIRFDMSEFKEEHAAALLYGAPPGYVGYEEGGLLVNKIRRQPFAVVLFDEIEKAHPSVFDVFLQIMDEGKLHDKLGKTGDFSNAVIIFTSNIGSKFVVDSFNNSKIPASSQLIDIMSNHFRPEFLGRLTEIIPFGPMKLETVRGILNIQLKTLFTALEKQGIELEIDNKAKDVLAQQGFTPEYGARPLAGTVRNQLRRPLSKKIITGEIKAGSVLKLTAAGETLKWVS